MCVKGAAAWSVTIVLDLASVTAAAWRWSGLSGAPLAREGEALQTVGTQGAKAWGGSQLPTSKNCEVSATALGLHAQASDEQWI